MENQNKVTFLEKLHKKELEDLKKENKTLRLQVSEKEKLKNIKKYYKRGSFIQGMN